MCPFFSDLVSGDLERMENGINEVKRVRGGFSAGVDGLISWLNNKSITEMSYWIWTFGVQKGYFVIGGIIKN